MTRTDHETDIGDATPAAPGPGLELFPNVEKAVAKILEPIGLEAYPFHVNYYSSKSYFSNLFDVLLYLT